MFDPLCGYGKLSEGKPVQTAGAGGESQKAFSICHLELMIFRVRSCELVDGSLCVVRSLYLGE